MISNEKLSTTKFYNFSRSTTLVLIVYPSEVVWRIWISNVRKSGCSFPWIDDFKWKSCELKRCITFRHLQALFWSFLHPRSFEKIKFQMWKFKRNFRWIDDFKCKSCQLQRCICFWDPQLLLWSLLHPWSFTMSAHTACDYRA